MSRCEAANARADDDGVEADGGAASTVEGGATPQGECLRQVLGVCFVGGGGVRAKVRARGRVVRDRSKSIQTCLEGTVKIGFDLGHHMYIISAIERLQPPNSSSFRYPFLGHLDSEGGGQGHP